MLFVMDSIRGSDVSKGKLSLLSAHIGEHVATLLLAKRQVPSILRIVATPYRE